MPPPVEEDKERKTGDGCSGVRFFLDRSMFLLLSFLKY